MALSGQSERDRTAAVAFENDLITEETALLYCVNRNQMRQRIDAIKKEAAKLEKRLHELGKEAGQLEALVNALK